MSVDLDKSVQDILNDEFMQDTGHVDNDMVLNLQFMRHFGNRLSSSQVKGILYLQDCGLGDIADHVLKMRKETTHSKKFFDMINKFTLADRIKGSAKLKDIVKASASSPSNSISMANMSGAKELKESDIR